MKSLFYVFTTCLVMGLAYWAYHENYQTQAAIKDSARLKSEIGRLRETLAILEAEWAYLNRPDRLAELAEINFDSLGLLPLMPEQFGTIDEVSFPPPPFLAMSQPIEVMGQLKPGEQFP